MQWLSPVSPDHVALVARRPNERKIGEDATYYQPGTPLNHYRHCQFAFIGIPEDIGPRANCGLGGSDQAWYAFLKRFLNNQSNEFIQANEFLLLGTVKCDDLQQDAANLDNQNESDLAQLRLLCSELDQRVADILLAIHHAGLIPIIIGGGHNNAFPAIHSLSQATNSPISCINLDPHSDFRPPEGRHSGNGFSYAKKAGYLANYFVIGLHEQKNSAENLALLAQSQFPYCTYQQIWTRREISLTQALQQAADYVESQDLPVGIELDVDAIAFVPASAYTNCGINFQDAEHYVYYLARHTQANYLHLAEGAPARHPCGLDAGINDVGQVLSGLVCAYIQGKKLG